MVCVLFNGTDGHEYTKFVTLANVVLETPSLPSSAVEFADSVRRNRGDMDVDTVRELECDYLRRRVYEKLGLPAVLIGIIREYDES